MSYPLTTIVITGAGRGIGKACALHLGVPGTHIICISKSENAECTAAEIRAQGGSADAILTNLANLQQTKDLLTAKLQGKSLGKVGLILAAGALGPQGPIHATDLVAWQEAFAVNLLGNLAVYQVLAPHLLSSRFGRILMFAGGGAAYAYPLFPAYAASKVAIVRTVENIHADLHALGDFAVVALAPGAIETDMLRAVEHAGGMVKTRATMDLPLRFVKAYMQAVPCQLSGRYIHVKDNWGDYLGSAQSCTEEQWQLRRIEA